MQTQVLCLTSLPSPCSDNFEGEAFEVFGFGEVEHDGVVEALGVSGDETQRLFRIVRGLGDVFEKHATCGVVGATIGREDAAFF